jgi:beta-phosphoglucomutase
LNPQFHHLDAVIFDCDGVLVDTERVHHAAYQHILEPLGLGFDYGAYVERYIGMDDRDCIATAFRSAGRDIDAAELSGLIDAKSKAVEQIVSTRGVATFPGLISLVEELRSHQTPIAIASGSLSHEIRLYLKALGLEDAFRQIVAADHVKRSKPDPESYAKAVERLRLQPGMEGLEARRCVAIEDTPDGVESARGAGLCVIGVTHTVNASDLSKANCVVESLTELSLSFMKRLVASCE